MLLASGKVLEKSHRRYHRLPSLPSHHHTASASSSSFLSRAPSPPERSFITPALGYTVSLALPPYPPTLIPFSHSNASVSPAESTSLLLTLPPRTTTTPVSRRRTALRLRRSELTFAYRRLIACCLRQEVCHTLHLESSPIAPLRAPDHLFRKPSTTPYLFISSVVA